MQPLVRFAGLMKLEAGTQVGEKLRVRGHGMPSVRRSGSFGDLYIDVAIRFSQRIHSDKVSWMPEVGREVGAPVFPRVACPWFGTECRLRDTCASVVEETLEAWLQPGRVDSTWRG